MTNFKEKCLHLAQKVEAQFDGKTPEQQERLPYYYSLGGPFELRRLCSGSYEVQEAVTRPDGATIAEWDEMGADTRFLVEREGKAHFAAQVGNISSHLIDCGYQSQPFELKTRHTKTIGKIKLPTMSWIQGADGRLISKDSPKSPEVTWFC